MYFGFPVHALQVVNAVGKGKHIVGVILCTVVVPDTRHKSVKSPKYSAVGFDAYL